MNEDKPRPRRARTTRPAAPILLPQPGPAAATSGELSDQDTAPKRLDEHGRRLWTAITSEFELAPHEQELLEQACRTADLVAALEVATADGVLLNRDGRMRPEIVELRHQRQQLARLLVALRIPLGADGERVSGRASAGRPQRRGMRGAYRPRGVS